MDPNFQQPTELPPEVPSSTAGNGKKKLFIGIGVGVAVIIAALATFLLWPKGNEVKNTAQKNISQPVSFSTVKEPVSYAGTKVYDACNLISIDLLKKHIEGYDESYKTMGTTKFPKQPLVMDHGYIDRTIPQPLGDDAKLRDLGIIVGGDAIDRSVRAANFMSIRDSHCTYGQGENFNSEFAQVFVLQPPAPLHPKLIAYLAELKKAGRLAIEASGVQVYIQPIKKGDQTNIGIFRKGNLVVFFSSRSFDLLQAASDQIFATLSKEPTGPMTAKYPDVYPKLSTNACNLLSADEFQRLLGRPSSAVITETLFLTDSEANTASRKCSRIEVERFRAGEISSVNYTISESRTEEQTKNRVVTLKNHEFDTIAPVTNSGLGDEAYSITNGVTKRYSLAVRVGKVLLFVETGGETKDANLDAFLARARPIAETIITNLKKI